MDQVSVIIENKDILQHLDPAEYPELVRLAARTKIIHNLNLIMDHMLTYLCPVWPTANRRYFLFSITHMTSWAKSEHQCKSGNKTWQGYIAFLDDAGLIKRLRVTGPSEDEFLNSIWLKTQERTRENRYGRMISETLWTVPSYTPEVLKHAEEIAALYRQHHINLSHLSKSDMIRLRGSEIADRLYHDHRVISREETLVHDTMVTVINGLIEAKGYTTGQELETTLSEKISESLGFTHSDPMRQNEWTTGDLDSYEQEKLYRKEIKKAMARKKAVCAECGCVYGQATREQRAFFSLPNHSWIIIKNDWRAPD